MPSVTLKMILQIGLLTFIVFTACLPSTETDPYEGGLEMWEEPMHQLVMEKDNFKLMNVLIPAGDTCLFHIHRHPTIYVLLNGAKYGGQNWGKEWEHSILTDIAWAGMVQDMTKPYTTSEPAVYHRVTIPDNEDYHLMALVHTGEGDQSVDTSSRPVNSPWFRENRFKVDAGQQSDIIKLEHQSVLIQYTEGHSNILENGVSHSFKSQKGGYSYHEANVAFKIENSSTTEQKFVAIELK